MWHKADWMEHPMRLELTLAGLLVKLANQGGWGMTADMISDSLISAGWNLQVDADDVRDKFNSFDEKQKIER